MVPVRGDALFFGVLIHRALEPDAFLTGPRGPAYSFWVVDKNLNSQIELQV